MRSFVEVLGPGTADAAAGLHLFFDDARYIFECGDGVQRYCNERAVRLGRLRAICLTSLQAPSLGGLVGMVLTLADAGKAGLTLAAPTGLRAVFDAARRASFCHRPSFAARIVEIDSAGTEGACKPRVVCDDDNLTISAVPVPLDPAPDRPPAHHASSYICRLKDVLGKFDPVKAVELGVPKGPEYGKLKRGIPVALADGTEIHPSSVVSPSTPGPLVLVIACPTVHHVRGVAQNPSLDPQSLGLVDADGVVPDRAPACVLYHLSPREVLAHPEYQAWCARFGAAVEHVTLHASMAPDRIVFSSQASHLDTLHRFDPDRFHAPWQSVREAATRGQPVGMIAQRDGSPEEFLASQTALAVKQWRVGDCGQKFVLTPVDSVGVCDDDVPPRFVSLVNTAEKVAPGHWKSFAASEDGNLDDAADTVCEPSCVGRLDRTTAEVVFLGTAGAIPGKYRNVSGIYLHLFGRGGMILDCGEGTWGQLTRAYGLEQARAILKSLSIIYVSHIHADHHLGLLTLLHEREACVSSSDPNSASSRLVVIGPTSLGNWLDAYYAALRGDCPSSQQLYRFCDASFLVEPESSESQFLIESFGLHVSCVRVIHCPHSYGVVVKDRVKGWSLVYSGDTRPCPALAKAARGATLAIHEATLDDSMEMEAIDKNHCTTSEALTVCGVWMEAWRTILTHFSQRYPLVPFLDRRAMSGLQKHRAAISFDLMRVNFADLGELPQIMPAVREAFSSELPPLEPLEVSDNSDT